MTPRLTKNVGESLRAAGALSTVGLSFVFAIGIGYWLGTVIDRWLDTKPIFTLVFSFLGLAAGGLSVYRIVSQAYLETRPSGPAGPAGSADALQPGPAEPGPSPTTSARPSDRDLYDDGGR